MLLAGLIFMSSCAPKLTFRVIKPAEMEIEGIEMISVGSFIDELGQEVSLPEGVGPISKVEGDITAFPANTQAADILRAYILSGLSDGRRFQILNTTPGSTAFSGVIPNDSKIGVLQAKVRYFNQTDFKTDEKFYVLLVTKNNVSLGEKALIMGLKSTALKMAEDRGKGFMVPTPAVEMAAAMEVQIAFVRKSDQSDIIPPQSFKVYYAKKWGGNQKTSGLAKQIKSSIDKVGLQKDAGIFSQLESLAEKGELIFSDPEESKSKGYLLKQNGKVPLVPLDIKMILAKKIASDFVRKISPYSVEANLSIASGDSNAETLLKGNAYEEAINRLEGLKKPLDSSDLYNLALAYEAIGEYHQALRYYQEGQRKTGDDEFKQGVKRVGR